MYYQNDPEFIASIKKSYGIITAFDEFIKEFSKMCKKYFKTKCKNSSYLDNIGDINSTMKEIDYIYNNQ